MRRDWRVDWIDGTQTYITQSVYNELAASIEASCDDDKPRYLEFSSIDGAQVISTTEMIGCLVTFSEETVALNQEQHKERQAAYPTTFLEEL